MKAIIKLDVPKWQIGKDVTVYFPDTMQKRGKCELPEEQETEELISNTICEIDNQISPVNKGGSDE